MILEPMNQVLTFSHGLMLPLTRACGAECSYCTFKSNQTALLTFDEIETLIRTYQASGAYEVVLMSGQSLDEIPGFSDQWLARGFSSFTEYLRDVCQLVLEHQMLPTLDVGPLTYAQLETLAPFITSITLLLENVNLDFMATVQSNKRIDDKIETMNDAAHFRIPVNTGLLIGAGEALDDAFATLQTIEELSQRLQTIQSVKIQCVVSPNRKDQPITPEVLSLLSKYSHKLMPDVPVIISHSSPVAWWEYQGVLVDDIGPLFEGLDGLEWTKNQPKVTEVQRELAKHGWTLRPRLPIFEKHFDDSFQSDIVRDVLAQWTSQREFSSYRNN